MHMYIKNKGGKKHTHKASLVCFLTCFMWYSLGKQQEVYSDVSDLYRPGGRAVQTCFTTAVRINKYASRMKGDDEIWLFILSCFFFCFFLRDEKCESDDDRKQVCNV